MNSKRSQPLSTKRATPADPAAAADLAASLETRIQELETEVDQFSDRADKPLRRRLPDTRPAVTHKFDIAGHEGYLSVGLFEDQQPGELFITMAKEGSTIGGLMDGIGTLTSLALQYGVPLEALVRKFAHVRFEPSGFTKNPEVRNAASIINYVFRWMAFQFVPGYREANTLGTNQPELAIPGLQEELKKKINRPVSDLAVAEDNDFVDPRAKQRSLMAGKTGSRHTLADAPGPRTIKTLSDSVAHFQQDAPDLSQLRPRRRSQWGLLQVLELRGEFGL